jgi:hypothetical protein
MSDNVAFLNIVVVILFVYFIPTIVAQRRDHHNALAISILNLFLGWTFLGWLASLVWACTATQGSIRRYS